jgi:hypothetical protein
VGVFVEFDDEFGFGVVAVDGVGADRVVGERSGDAVGIEEAQELALEVAAGVVLALRRGGLGCRGGPGDGSLSPRVSVGW